MMVPAVACAAGHRCSVSVLPGCSLLFTFFFLVFFSSFFFSHTSTFQLLDKPWSQVSSLLPPVLAFNFYRAWGLAIPLLVDFSSSVANSRSRAFRKSICAQETATYLYEYALGGI